MTSYSSINWSPQKCGIIWLGAVSSIAAFMVPLGVMVNHYNDAETDRANACTSEHGAYLDGHCTWTSR